MGFYIKKIMATLLEPLSLVFFLLGVGLWYLYKHKLKKARYTFIAALFLLTLFSYKPFSMLLIYPLESQYKKLTQVPRDIEYIVFIGGDFENRAWELLRLHQLLPQAKILVSGYEGPFLEAEAVRAKRILNEVGIPSHAIIAYAKPKDTIEEAQNIKHVLGDKAFILITAAYHMPRAMMIFRHEGLNPLAAPTDFTRHRRSLFLSWPNAKSLHYTERAWHEYLGILWLLLKSY